MKTEENIITIKEIDDFLQEDSNKDIVRKHFKLWLYASNILSNINNPKRFIDCESLLADIATESKYYVQTNTYDKCVHLIHNLNVLIIIGAPGVGKTTISKMLVLYYASLGYRIRYKTNGQIGNLKKEVFLDEEAKDVKEMILLDDCMGQSYFNMNENQENEIISLINLVKMNNNKKLILNSLVTIMNEAKSRSIDFEKTILRNNEKIYIINMDNTSIDEKARILYNHIYFKNLPREYYDYVRRDKNYQRIVKHHNYTPRIIDYITEEYRYKDIMPDGYFDFVMGYLNNPEGIWRDEYEKRLGTVDRILIKTLFSITDTTIDYSVIEKCFSKRLDIENTIDVTSNNFDDAIDRLNRSMIKIIDKNNKKEISVLNPSVNDYIKNIFFKNVNDLENIRKSIVYYEQLERCYSGNEVQDAIKEKIRYNTFTDLKVYDTNICVNIETLLLHYICEFNMLSLSYIDIIKDYLLKLEDEPWIKNSRIIKSKIINSFFEEPLFSFYKIDKHTRNLEFLESILLNIELKDLDKICNKLDTCVYGEELKKVEKIILEDAKEKISDYLENFTIELFVDDIDFWDYFDSNYHFVSDLNIDEDEKLNIKILKTEEEIYDDFIKYVKDDIESSVNKINNKQIKLDILEFFNSINFKDYSWKNDIDSYVEGMLEPDYQDYDDDYSSHEEDNLLYGDSYSDFINPIDGIFDR